MYSASRNTVNGAVCAALMFLPLAQRGGRLPASPLVDVRCEARLQSLFAPPVPQLGRYEVCISDRAISDLLPAGWPVEDVPPLDAFGNAGAYSRPQLSHLYAGEPARVARGWIDEGGQFESRTYISPHPDARLERLLPGTLIVRFIICCK